MILCQRIENKIVCSKILPKIQIHENKNIFCLRNFCLKLDIFSQRKNIFNVQISIFRQNGSPKVRLKTRNIHIHTHV